MKQTAVEWLVQQLSKEWQIEDRDLHLIEQAKQMEEEQHQKTWFESTTQFDNAAEMTYRKEFKQYYNETFKSE
jgi:hypothetical protein